MLILYFYYYFQLATYTIVYYCNMVTVKQGGNINTDRLKLQRTTVEKIKKINSLQQDELVEIVSEYVEKAIDVINDRGGKVEVEINETLIELLLESGFGGFKRLFTQEEVRVNLNTLNALGTKKILEYEEPFGLDGAGYWKWTGKELE